VQEIGASAQVGIGRFSLKTPGFRAHPHFVFPRSSGFKSFPDVLVVHMRKFQLVNWVPTKLGEGW
jgi:hypothetical protein